MSFALDPATAKNYVDMYNGSSDTTKLGWLRSGERFIKMLLPSTGGKEGTYSLFFESGPASSYSPKMGGFPNREQMDPAEFQLHGLETLFVKVTPQTACQAFFNSYFTPKKGDSFLAVAGKIVVWLLSAVTLGLLPLFAWAGTSLFGANSTKLELIDQEGLSFKNDVEVQATDELRSLFVEALQSSLANLPKDADILISQETVIVSTSNGTKHVIPLKLLSETAQLAALNLVRTHAKTFVELEDIGDLSKVLTRLHFPVTSDSRMKASCEEDLKKILSTGFSLVNSVLTPYSTLGDEAKTIINNYVKEISISSNKFDYSLMLNKTSGVLVCKVADDSNSIERTPIRA